MQTQVRLAQLLVRQTATHSAPRPSIQPFSFPVTFCRIGARPSSKEPEPGVFGSVAGAAVGKDLILSTGR